MITLTLEKFLDEIRNGFTICVINNQEHVDYVCDTLQLLGHNGFMYASAKKDNGLIIFESNEFTNKINFDHNGFNNLSSIKRQLQYIYDLKCSFKMFITSDINMINIDIYDRWFRIENSTIILHNTYGFAYATIDISMSIREKKLKACL